MDDPMASWTRMVDVRCGIGLWWAVLREFEGRRVNGGIGAV